MKWLICRLSARIVIGGKVRAEIINTSESFGKPPPPKTTELEMEAVSKEREEKEIEGKV